MTYPRHYEEVTSDLWRIKVIGGWIVRGINIDNPKDGQTMCFIADPKHNWKLKHQGK